MNKSFDRIISAEKVREISINHGSLGPKETLILLVNLRNLKVINLEENNISDQGIILLPPEALSSVESFSLYGNYITDVGLKDLVENKNLKKLSELNLSNNFISEVGLKNLLENNTLTLNTLSISTSNKIPSNFWGKLKKSKLTANLKHLHCLVYLSSVKEALAFLELFPNIESVFIDNDTTKEIRNFLEARIIDVI